VGIHFTWTLMTEEDARIILTWKYEAPYSIYNYPASETIIAQMLERRSPYYAARNEQRELVGFFCFGTVAQVWDNDIPALSTEDHIIDIGLAMRPDLTGKGLGLDFVKAGLCFAEEQFTPQRFRLFVLAWNQRAIRVYEKAGFICTREFIQPNPVRGELPFIEMQRDV
jgi:[ribosomal protein S18]-alanine N-acetyltransferase